MFANALYECWNFFETRKEDPQRLLLNLRFPEKCVLQNGSTMPGKEVMLRGLYELFFGADQHEVVPIFGRDQTQQSRAFKYFVIHIYDNFLHLVTDNLRERIPAHVARCHSSQILR